MGPDSYKLIEELKRQELNCRYPEGVLHDGSPYTGNEQLSIEKRVIEVGLLNRDQITEAARTYAADGDEYCGNHRMWAIFRLLGISTY